ncbi:hypothetical protein AAHA92_00075 [Salvia divinorum]|uniref:Uncharacterized protein n=1 Tax=Salvia divinorum TaxID=28513 RepID=A0ABD1IJ24_SALDI
MKSTRPSPIHRHGFTASNLPRHRQMSPIKARNDNIFPRGVVGSKAPNHFLPVNELYSSPKGSSCASWSPFPTSQKTAP